MQNTSPLYRQILADPDHYFETTVVIGDSGDLVTEFGERIIFGIGSDETAIVVARSGADSGFTESQIFFAKTIAQMFGNDPEVGNAISLGKAISQEIEVQMLQPAGDIPPMGVVVPYVRACTNTQKSEWLQQGVFYIDTRETTASYDGIKVLTLHGFDSMMTAEQYWSDTGRLDWSQGTVSDTEMVSDIASVMGISVDPRTWDIMINDYQIPMPVQYTLREILGYIASMYAGCFIINEIGQLRLVSILEIPPETNLLIDTVGDYLTFGQEPNEVCRIKV